jgi:hypothetical protein
MRRFAAAFRHDCSRAARRISEQLPVRAMVPKSPIEFEFGLS